MSVPEGTGVVHLGVGAFAKAFVLAGIERAMEAGGGDWHVLGVSLRRPDQRDALLPRGFRYHAVEMAGEERIAREITVLRDVLVAPEDPEAVLSGLADPAIRLVTLTVTEKGYGHEPATGRLDRRNPDVAHDLSRDPATRPRSAVGFLVEALARRHAAGTRPFTALSCDNLPGNGETLRGLVTEMARERDDDLAAWIAREARFPSSMVDRIVPAVTADALTEVERLLGERDEGAVLHEPFLQWVVEDDFVDGQRPDLASAGVELVDDVAPFEAMKLRCLNGAHSALAYLGFLAGHETMADAVSDERLAGYVRALWRREVVPSLTAPPGADLVAYCEALLARFGNPAMRHRTWQIAMDGSQKLPQRLLRTARDNLAAGRPVERVALAVAAWMRYVSGTDERGEPIDVRDPMSERLREAARAERPVDALLAFDEVFGDLGRHRAFRDAVAAAHHRLCAVGAGEAAAALA